MTVDRRDVIVGAGLAAAAGATLAGALPAASLSCREGRRPI